MQNIPTQINYATSLDADPFNDFASESENAIISSGQTLAPPSPKDNFQLAKAMATYAARGAFYRDIGTANNYVLSVFGSQQSPNEYVDGMLISFVPSNTNSGTSSVNVNSLGSKDLKDSNGNNLLASTLVAGVECQFRYSLATDDFRLTGVFSRQTQFIPEWNISLTYSVGDRVLRNGNTYRCTQATTAGDDPIGPAKNKWFSNEVVYRLRQNFNSSNFSTLVGDYVDFYRQGNQIICSLGAQNLVASSGNEVVLSPVPVGFRPLLTGDALSVGYTAASVYVTSKADSGGSVLSNAYYIVVKESATNYRISMINGDNGGQVTNNVDLIWFTNAEPVNASSTIHPS